MTQPIPEGYHSVTPYLVFKDAKRAIDFYTAAFGAVQTMELTGPGDKIGHAELRIGDSNIMLADEFPEMGALSADSIGGSPISLMIYAEDVDTIFTQALAAGGEEVRPVEDQFYGDRTGTLKDPFGYQWTIATHKEDVSQEVAQKRYDEMISGGES